ncbi:nitrate/nitrite transporter NrtS [Salinibius halmophilus]|uniref:nitrate/nitrite transporter NrtS n=1 Tax=Salinibius halmophilus TaxID=1853216 RepID=UPI000E66A502|nr:nitrate/nitrite transporter NrtS [Salinibius halmophilus]
MPASVLKKAFNTALVVGTLLTLINQWDALFGDASLRVIPLLLTYCVPFCVYCYGWWSNQPKP